MVGSSPSKWVSGLLRLSPSAYQKQVLNTLVGLFNISIQSRYADLRKGFFNELSIPFNTSYRSKDGHSQDTPIDPGTLNYGRRARWPVRYENDRVLSEGSSGSLHVSLTPVISYPTDEMLLKYKAAFEETLRSMDVHQFRIKFQPQFRVFSRVDYSRFFLVLSLTPESAHSISPVTEALSAIRKRGAEYAGMVRGESQRSEQSILSRLHVSIGICSFPMNRQQDRDSDFGEYELHFMNEVLLKPKDQLLSQYGADVSTLQYCSDVKTQLTPQEVEDLAFDCNVVSLSLNGGKVEYNL